MAEDFQFFLMNYGIHTDILIIGKKIIDEKFNRIEFYKNSEVFDVKQKILRLAGVILLLNIVYPSYLGAELSDFNYKIISHER